MASNVAKRSGWVTFAGVAALVVGAYNALGGLAAVTDDDALRAQASKVLYGVSLNAWGWFWLLVGLAQFATGVLIIRRNEWGRALGICFAGISAVITIFIIFVYPLYAIAVLAIDFVILYGLFTGGDDFV